MQFGGDDGDATCRTLADGVPSKSCDATFVMPVHRYLSEQHNITLSLIEILHNVRIKVLKQNGDNLHRLRPFGSLHDCSGK